MGFLDYEVEIRKITCSANAIEALNAHYRRGVRANGHFPTEQAALKWAWGGDQPPQIDDQAASDPTRSSAPRA